MGESSLNLGLELGSLMELLHVAPAALPKAGPNTDWSVSRGALQPQSTECEKADDANPGLGPHVGFTSRELRWFRLLGHVEIRERVLSAGVGVAAQLVALSPLGLSTRD